MEPIYLSIQQKETGSRIKSLLRESGYTVRDIQNAMGFENPQAVYKWISGICASSGFHCSCFNASWISFLRPCSL